MRTDNSSLQAISNQNFRYTGARLCYHLEQNCPLFRTQLHLACSKELEDGPNKQNVLLFVSELYTQLNHQNIYGNLVTDGLKLLLMAGGNDNIKCTCQALKVLLIKNVFVGVKDWFSVDGA